ncbi:MAG: aminotransferase class V-fold PLP-dependent enzyme [Candidatus Thorarchaeota archaeon]|nr:aminotransferase class V-fold PLP-dependent enzyme [Candidatus Thorarchaeota archaeon]
MTDLIESEFISKTWPTLSQMTYLNNASTGIPPVNAFKAMKQYLDNSANAAGKIEDTLKAFKEIRQNLATLLGGDYNQYAFVPSTSEGVNTIAHSVEYPPGSNVVLCDLEFPANYVPWQNASKLYGFDLRVVKSDEGAAPLESFKDKVDENTKVIAVSQIQFGTGFRSDLSRLSKLAHDNSAILSVDVIQAAGCIDTDLVKSGVDFATGQSAKWLLGPIGAGYIFVGQSVLEKLRPRFIGWWGVEELMEFEYRERTPLPDARKFQVGSPSMVSYVGLLESLKTLLQIPGKVRETAALSNSDYLRKRLSERDIPFYDFGPENNSAIVSCKPQDVEKLHEELLKNKIHCSVRNGRLRISPHLYNNQDEIDKIVDNLR